MSSFVQRMKNTRCRYAARLPLRMRNKFRIRSSNCSILSFVHNQACFSKDLLSFKLLCVYCNDQSTNDRSTVINVSDDRPRSIRPKTRRLNPSFDVSPLRSVELETIDCIMNCKASEITVSTFVSFIKRNLNSNEVSFPRYWKRYVHVFTSELKLYWILTLFLFIGRNIA